MAAKILDQRNHDKSKQLDLGVLTFRLMALAQILAEKKFYPYQVSVAKRIIESVLLHDGDVITAILSRQVGKTETLGATCAALALALPALATQHPEDWMLNITDDRGVNRGFRHGFKIGIYAPRLDQSGIMFDRVKKCFSSDSAKRVLQEFKCVQDVSNGNCVELSNRSRILCESASEQSKIEGATHQLVICEEAQDISDMKIRKSIHPMVASTQGTIVKIGTASTRKCDFYSSIKTNQRMELVTGKKNNFSYDYRVCEKFNSLYKKYIEQEKIRLGEDSDEFRTSYLCHWIFERGMFVTNNQLFNKEIAQIGGVFGNRQPRGLHAPNYSHYSIVAGIDWGKSHDSTVLTLVAVDWLNPVYYSNSDNEELPFVAYKKHVVDWLEFIGDNYEDQFWSVYDYLNQVRNLRKIVTDSNTCGQPIFDRLTATYSDKDIEVVPFNFQPKVKSEGYRQFYNDICAKRFTFPASAEVRQTKEYRKFINQMLDAQKTIKGNLLVVAHPDEKEAHDDFCFVSVSHTLTKRGSIPIKEVVVGDEVMTRKGWKKVTFSGQTGVSEVIRVGNLVATANHPFFCVNKNRFIPLAELEEEDIVMSCVSITPQKNNSKNLKERFTTDCLIARKALLLINTFTHTTPHLSLLSTYIEKFGNTILEKFQKVVLFITRMTTPSTTALATCSYSPHLNTLDFTCETQNESESIERPLSSQKQPLLIRLFGSLKRIKHSKETKLLRSGLSKSTESSFVKNVEIILKQEPTPTLKLVPVSVRHAVGDAETLKYFESIPLGTAVPVYNLTVEDEHEFICQGVLVHNCDSAMMACFGASTPSNSTTFETLKNNPFV